MSVSLDPGGGGEPPPRKPGWEQLFFGCRNSNHKYLFPNRYSLYLHTSNLNSPFSIAVKNTNQVLDEKEVRLDDNNHAALTKILNEVEDGQIGQTTAHTMEAAHWLANGAGIFMGIMATGVNRHQSFRIGRGDPGTPMDLTGFTFSMLGFVLNSLGAMGTGVTQANYRKIGQSSKYGPTNYRDKK